MKKEDTKKAKTTAAASAVTMAAAAAATALSGHRNETNTTGNATEEQIDDISIPPHIGHTQNLVQPEMFAEAHEQQTAHPTDRTAHIADTPQPSASHAATSRQEPPIVEELTDPVLDEYIPLAQEVTPLTPADDSQTPVAEQLISDTATEPLACAVAVADDEEEFGGDFIDENDNTAIDTTHGYAALRASEETDPMPLPADSTDDILQDIHNLL